MRGWRYSAGIAIARTARRGRGWPSQLRRLRQCPSARLGERRPTGGHGNGGRWRGRGLSQPGAVGPVELLRGQLRQPDRAERGLQTSGLVPVATDRDCAWRLVPLKVRVAWKGRPAASRAVGTRRCHGAGVRLAWCLAQPEIGPQKLPEASGWVVLPGYDQTEQQVRGLGPRSSGDRASVS
jgi:hypothetical protein